MARRNENKDDQNENRIVERVASDEENKRTDERMHPEADKTEQVSERKYGDDITVETAGDYQMYDANTSLMFPGDKAVKTQYTRFIESALRQGKMREGTSDGVETIELNIPKNEGVEGRGENDREDRQTTSFTRGSTGDEAKSRRSVS